MNIFNGNTIYLTEEELKQTTSIQEIADMTNDQLKIIINKAEHCINNYLGYTASGDDLIDFKIATFYQVEYMFNDDGNPKITSFSVGDRKTEYSIGKENEYGLSDKAISILKNYKFGFFSPQI